MRFLALDLEMNQPSRKIIEIGAVIGEGGKILDTFQCYVNPGEVVSPYIESLCGVTNELICLKGVTLSDAYDRLVLFSGSYGPFMNPVTWGGGDSLALLSQLPPGTKNIFGRRWIDVKTLHIAKRFANNEPIQGGLSKALIRHGLKFEGRKHCALDDAKNTYRLFHKILEELK